VGSFRLPATVFDLDERWHLPRTLFHLSRISVSAPSLYVLLFGSFMCDMIVSTAPLSFSLGLVCARQAPVRSPTLFIPAPGAETSCVRQFFGVPNSFSVPRRWMTPPFSPCPRAVHKIFSNRPCFSPSH